MQYGWVVTNSQGAKCRLSETVLGLNRSERRLSALEPFGTLRVNSAGGRIEAKVSGLHYEESLMGLTLVPVCAIVITGAQAGQAVADGARPSEESPSSAEHGAG